MITKMIFSSLFFPHFRSLKTWQKPCATTVKFDFVCLCVLCVLEWDVHGVFEKELKLKGHSQGDIHRNVEGDCDPIDRGAAPKAGAIACAS
jgi:hypothetical protein